MGLVRGHYQKLRFFRVLVCLLVATAAHSGSNRGSEPPPSWAYVVPPADAKPALPDGRVLKVPDSNAHYTAKQVRDPFLAPDWHPEDHPKMPPIVAHGRKPAVMACGYCHRADGPGGPENASLAGLPYDYIVEQMADFKNGRRSTAIPTRLPQANMIVLAKAATDEEVRAAAKYFSSLKPRQNIRVVEKVNIPKTHVAGWVLATQEGKEMEPLAGRIVETPENLEQFESRDTRAKFVAYVPVRSLLNGAAIVRGQRLGPPCVSCHGRDYRGHELAPSIAGRSPSYVFRQLYEMQNGIRTGSGVKLMKVAMARLSTDEMRDVAAYLATQKP